MTKRFLALVAFGALGAFLFTSCSSGGGGGGGSPSGVFLDSVVEGLDFTSGTISGTTGPDGRFTYSTADPVVFTLGDIEIGQATGQSSITPVDLVPGAVDEQDETVTNIARFLQTLDEDENPDNGILLNDLVRQAAIGQAVVFTQNLTDFETNAQPVVDLLSAGLSNGPRPLIPVQEARDHLASTLLTTIAGKYEGTFTGTDSGTFAVFIDRNGRLIGFAISVSDGLISLDGTGDTAGGFVAGSASTGATFTGQIDSAGSLSGDWQLSPDSGTFSGSRTMPVANDLDEGLLQQLAGTYSGTVTSNLGTDTFTATLDAEGNFSVPPPDDDTVGALSSTGASSATLVGVNNIGCRFTGTVTDTGSMSGTFFNSYSGESGSFSGTKN